MGNGFNELLDVDMFLFVVFCFCCFLVICDWVDLILDFGGLAARI